MALPQYSETEPTAAAFNIRIAHFDFLKTTLNVRQSYLNKARTRLNNDIPGLRNGTASQEVRELAYELCLDLAQYYLRFDRERTDQSNVPSAVKDLGIRLDAEFEALKTREELSGTGISFVPFEPLDVYPPGARKLQPSSFERG